MLCGVSSVEAIAVKETEMRKCPSHASFPQTRLRSIMALLQGNAPVHKIEGEIV
jgi:hypothetical protein